MNKWFKQFGLTIVLFTGMLYLVSVVEAADAWFNSGYKYRKKLTIDNTLVSGSSDLSNFPVLISYTDGDLATTGNGGQVESSSGFDIIFTDADPSAPAQLDHEIHSYTDTSGKIIMWVRLSTLHYNDDTDIYIYYGNSGIATSQEDVSGVWDSNYELVLHLQESGNGSDNEYIDSTSNNHHGTGGGLAGSGDSSKTPSMTTSGTIGNAQDFDDAGNQDLIRLNSVSDTSWTAVTVQAWINPDDAGDDRIFGKSWGTGSSDQTWLLRQTSGNIGSRMRSDSNNNGGCDSGALTTGTWYWVAVTWDASDDTVRVFRNGTQQTTCGLVGTTLYTTPTVSQPTIGNTTTEDRGFDGKLQEARVSKIARTADWMTTEYNNQSNQGTGSGSFIKTLGAEEGLFINLSGPSNLANSTVVRWAQNATLRSHNTTVINGSFSLDVGGTLSSGDMITIWADGVSDENEATAITEYHETGDVTGLLLQSGTLAMGHNEGTFTISMTELGQYDNTDDEDIIYVLTPGNTLEGVQSSMGMLITQGTFTIDGYVMDINGTLDIDGTLNAGNGAGGNSTIYVEGPWDATGGIFTSSNSTVVFTGTSSSYSYDIKTNGQPFNNLLINDGLVGYWKFDDATSTTVVDHSGYGNDGTWVGTQGSSISTSSTIKFANPRSADFDGDGDYIRARKPTSHQFTIALWINYDNTSANPNDGIGQAQPSGTTPTNTATDKDIGMWIERATARAWGRIVQSDNSARNLPTNAAATVSVGVWEHLVYRADGSDFELFLNGNTTPVSTVTYDGTIETHDPFFIGVQATEEWKGQMDDYRIYNRALSLAEIQALANGYQPATSLGTYTLQETLDINGTLSMLAGELDVGSNHNITLAGDWQNFGGVFDEQMGSVTLDGSDQAIPSSETFYNITKTMGSSSTVSLTIGQSSTVTVYNSLTLTGFNASSHLFLRSSSVGTRFYLNTPNSTQDIEFIDLRDGEAQGNDINAINSNDRANNDSGEGTPEFIFKDSQTITWDGGGIDGTCGGAGTANNWSCDDNWLGDVAPTNIDTALFDSTSSKTASVNTNIDVKGVRILSSFTGMINQLTGNSITIGSAGWDQAGGTVTGSDAIMDINGTFTVSGGTFNSTSGTISVADNFTLSSTGTFSNPTGTLNLDGDLIFTDSTSPQQNVGRVVVGSSPDVTDLASDMIGISLTIDAGDTLYTNGYDIDLSGTLTVNGTLEATDDVETDETMINVGQSLIINSGAMVVADQSTITFDGTMGVFDLITDGTYSLYNVVLDNSNNLTIEVEDPLDVNGNITITNGTLDVVSGENNTVTVGGDFDNNGVFLAQSGTITFDGGGAQTVSIGSNTFYNVEVTNTTADVTFDEAFTTTDFTATTAGTSLKFQQGTTFAISGSLYLDGGLATKVYLDSVNGSSRFTLDVTGSDQTVSNVNVSNSNASSNDINTTGSVDGGNNDEEEATPHWVFLVSFSDITSGANLGSSPGGGAVVIFDCNNDGYLDVFMGEDVTPSSSAMLRQNDGDNTFTDRDSQISNDYRGAGAGDYDNDGDTDLIFGFTQGLYTNTNATNCTFSSSTAGSVNNNEAIMFFDVDGDGDLDIWSPGEDYLWHRNDGGTTFTSQTSLPGGSTGIENGEGATAADFDNDGWVDLLWADNNTTSEAYTNDGDDTYTTHTDVATDFGLPEDVAAHENMEWAWGDCDNDGALDLYVSGADNEGLYTNNGSGTFTSQGSQVSFSDPDGADWGDVDNDGDLDLVVVNSGGVSALLANDGSCGFTDVTGTWGINGSGDIGSTAGFFDVDNDGDLDIISNNPLTLWRNNLDNANSFRVIAEGIGNGTGGTSPKTPIGAQITIYDAGTSTILGYQEIIGSFNQFMPPFRKHFGLDPAQSYDIEVRFPSGIVMKRNNVVPKNETHTIGSNTLFNTVFILERTGPLKGAIMIVD